MKQLLNVRSRPRAIGGTELRDSTQAVAHMMPRRSSRPPQPMSSESSNTHSDAFRCEVRTTQSTHRRMSPTDTCHLTSHAQQLVAY